MPRYIDLDRCTGLIAGFEGFRSYVYDDTTWPTRAVTRAQCYRNGEGQYVVRATGGIATLGYGETDGDWVDAHWGGVTEEEGRERLKLRVAEFADGVEKGLTRTPTAHQAEAMVSLAYNIGAEGFRTSTVRRKFNAGDLAGAADAFLMWVTPATLRDRRLIEIEHFWKADGPPPPPPDALDARGRTVLLFIGD